MSVYTRQGGVWVQASAGGPVTPPSTGVPPTAPSSLTLTPAQYSINVAWGAATDPDGDLGGYEILLDGVSQGSVTAGVRSSTLGNLEQLTAYTVAVRAFDSNGHTGPSRTASTTTLGSFGTPTRTNTGPQIGNLTTYNGDLILFDGDSYTGLYITGDVWQRGSNCSLTDCEVAGNVAPASFAAGTPSNSARNLTLTRVKAASLFNVGGFDGLVIDQSQFGRDGINDTVSQLVDSTTRAATGLVVRNSYFYGRPSYAGWVAEHNGQQGDPHWEAAHWVGVEGFSITNTVFDFSALNNDPDSRAHITAAMTFENSWTGSGRKCSGTFSGNHLYGGGYYQIYLNLYSNSVVNDNSFNSYAGQAGVAVIPTGASFTQSGNTLDGSPITL